MIINCPNCPGKLDRPLDLDYSIDVIQCPKCLTLWDIRFGEPEPYIREQHIPDTRPLPVGETPRESETMWDYEKREAEAHSNIIEPTWSRRQWATVLSLKEEVEGFRKRFYQGLNEINKKSKSKIHKY